MFFDADVAMLESEVTSGASLTGEPDMVYHQTFYYIRSYIRACFLKEMIFFAADVKMLKRGVTPDASFQGWATRVYHQIVYYIRSLG